MKTTCGLFIVNKKNELLCVHPTNHAINVWSIPKGMVKKGESYLEAAVRETREETGITFDLDKDIFHTINGAVEFKYDGGKKKKLSPHFIFEVDNPHLDFSRFKPRCESMVVTDGGVFPEVDSFGWVSIKVAVRFIHKTQYWAIKQYMDGRHPNYFN
jgi:predicted NUDIX family NTP pyrophosphohydrolase